MLPLSSKVKHFFHCCVFMLIIYVFQILVNFSSSTNVDPWTHYGYLLTSILYLSRLTSFLGLPQALFNFAGLVYYNAFPDKVELRVKPSRMPFICMRVVTRGDFPELVKKTVSRNLKKCEDAGLENFIIEVVSDKHIGIGKNLRIREIVVPLDYKTRSGALFKGRALQYCLEDGVNQLSFDDWIVHLDEETVLTENSIRGIFNFIGDGRHQLGQGLITYTDERVVNWLTTASDFFRVAFDLGELRLQLKMFHKLLIIWKGSFLVAQFGVERDITFDNGVESSIAEDIFFGHKAANRGYSFDFVEGEMWEKSPFTVWDYVQQRKRWIQGLTLIVKCKRLPLKGRIFTIFYWIVTFTLPFSVLPLIFPLPFHPTLNSIFAFITAVGFYLHVFGALKSVSISRFGVVGFALCICLSILVIPFNLGVQVVATIWGVFGKKSNFYIVDKVVKFPKKTEIDNILLIC